MFSDIELVRQCIEREDRAWKIFLNRFQPVVMQRIKQIFFRYGYRGDDSKVSEAFDYVIDHFVFGKGLSGFRNDESLPGYVLTVSTRTVIQWYRAQSTAKKWYGFSSSKMAQMMGETDVSVAKHDSETFADQFLESHVSFSADERVCYHLLMLNFREIDESDYQFIMQVSGLSREDLEIRLVELRTKIAAKDDQAEEKFADMQLLFCQIIALQAREGQAERLSRKMRALQELRSEYSKKGFQAFPSRQDITLIFGWDINKTDRLLRRVKEKLRNYLKMSDKIENA